MSAKEEKEAGNKVLSQTVAVIIVNYNGGQYLEKCLEALSKQSRKPDKVLIVDNNSDDFHAARINDRYPQVDILALDENTGFAAANNRAVRLLNGMEWVVLLNPDAYAQHDWLENFLAGARSHPDVHYFGCHMLAATENKQDGTGDVYHISGAVWRRDYGQAVGVKRGEGEIFSPSGAAALYRRDVFMEAGGFNEAFFCYLEDIDLGFRLQLLGYRCIYIPDAVVTHEGAALVGKHSDFQVYHGHRNLVWTYVMNMPAPWFWIYLPQHLLYNLASVLLFVYHGKSSVILRSKFDAIKGLPQAWRLRRQIQKKSNVDIGKLRKSMAHGFFSPYLNRYE